MEGFEAQEVAAVAVVAAEVGLKAEAPVAQPGLERLFAAALEPSVAAARQLERRQLLEAEQAAAVEAEAGPTMAVHRGCSSRIGSSSRPFPFPKIRLPVEAS